MDTKTKNENAAAASANNAGTSDSSSLGRQEIVDSLAKVRDLKYETTGLVTKVLTESDARESVRRVSEETKRVERLHALREEAVGSIEKNEEVDKRWEDLADVHMPQQLQRLIDEQRRRCEKIIESKDALITQFKLELKEKDEEYIKMLKHEAEDVETLLKRMGEQTAALRRRYDESLERIENAHVEERANMIRSNKEIVSNLFDKRRGMELRLMEEGDRREKTYMSDIASMRTKDSEDYNKLKIKLETDIQILEQQLQEMRATYQLNSEKLEYNYLVLIERDMENRATLKQKERRRIRLKEQLASLVQRYEKTDKDFKTKNEELTEEYTRATQQYKDLQKKFRHFQMGDVKKYKRVWHMHENEVRDIADDVLEADKIITEQQLGLTWRAPSVGAGKMFNHRGLSSRNLSSAPAAATSRGGLMTSESATTRGGSVGSSVAATKGGGPTSRRAAGDTTASSSVHGENGESLTTGGGRVRTEKIRRVLAMLRSEASFLAPNGDRASGNEVAQNAAILRALQVNASEDVDDLLTYFFDPAGDGNEELYEEDETVDMGDLGLFVRPEDVVQTIHQYMDDKNEMNLENGDAAAALAATAVSTTKKRASGMGDEAKVRHKRAKDAVFWEGMSKVVPDRTIRVWTALEVALKRYNAVLSDRADIVEESTRLRAQNAELKGLLNQYLGADINSELHVPPTQTIRLSRGNGGSRLATESPATK
eukprot:g3384.t1